MTNPRRWWIAAIAIGLVVVIAIVCVVEGGSLVSLMAFRTFSCGMPSFSASSSGVDSRPISLSSFRDVRMILLATSAAASSIPSAGSVQKRFGAEYSRYKQKVRRWV